MTGIQWHASPPKMKTDMLATQTADGDARVWAIPKEDKTASCTAVRMLSETAGVARGPNWLAWSRNGRIVQFIERYALVHIHRPVLN